MSSYEYHGCVTGFSESDQVTVWQPTANPMPVQHNANVYAGRLVDVGLLHDKVNTPVDNSSGDSSNSSGVSNGSSIEANNNWLMVANPMAKPSGSVLNINSTELGFNNGGWVENVTEGLIAAFYIALQFIQYPLAYRIYLPSLISHDIQLKIAAKQRIVNEQDGLPVYNDISYSTEPINGINDMSALIRVNSFEFTIFGFDFDRNRFDLNGASYIDVFFDSQSSFKVATDKDFIGNFSHRFDTNIVGIQMVRFSTDGSIKGDLQHLTVEKVPLANTLMSKQ